MSATPIAAGGRSAYLARRLAAAFACGLLLAGLAACRAPEDRLPASTELALRLIAEEPAEIFGRERILEVEEVFSWSFATDEDLQPWKILPAGSSARIQDNALRLIGQERPIQLVRPVDFDAAEVEAIEVERLGPHQGSIELNWALEDGRFRRPRRLVHSLQGPKPGRFGTEVLEVGSHPRWVGRITRLGLRPTTVKQRGVQVRRIRGIRYRLDPARLAAAVERPWKAELEGDFRNAFLAPPGTSIERRVDLSAAALLRFSYGLPETATAAARFRVSVETDGGPRRPLFEAELAPQPGAGWHPAQVDLPARRGPATLIFETEATSTFDSRQGVPLWANPELLRRAPTSRPNVVLISLDTLRADHLSLYGYRRQTSPHLDRWAAAKGVVMENAIASAPWTLPSHVSLFTGLDALSHGVNHQSATPQRLDLLAERLQAAGYRTMAVTGGVYLHPRFGLAQGFDRYFALQHDHSSASELENGIDRALGWLDEEAGRPFFLFFHTYEIHSPYRGRQPYLDRFRGEHGAAGEPPAFRLRRLDSQAEQGFVASFVVEARPPSEDGSEELSAEVLQSVTDHYDAGIAYADAQLARLLEALDEGEAIRPTLVVLTSDHGEALGEKGLAMHTYLYDFNLKVPLVFAPPGGRQGGRRVSRQVALVDVLPTVLELSGLEAAESIDGTSLAPLLEGGDIAAPEEAWSYAASSNRGVALRVANRLKYLYSNPIWKPIHGEERLFRLDRDPDEERGAPDGAPELAPLRRRTEQKLRSVPGIRLRFANDRGRSYRVSLTGPALNPGRVKGFGLPSPVPFSRLGEVSLLVPPETEFEVGIESPPPGELGIEIGAPGAGPRLSLSFAIEDLALPVHLVGEGDSWRRAEQGAAPPSRGVSLWTYRLAAASGEDPAADESLRQQLRALGYLD